MGPEARLEPYRPPLTPAWVGDAVYVAALVLFVLFLHVAHSLRRHERDTWWASNGRDVVNAAAVVTLFGAIVLQGIALPLALLFAATLTLLLTVLHESLAHRLAHPSRIVFAAALFAGAPLVVAPEAAARLAAAILRTAFDGIGLAF